MRTWLVWLFLCLAAWGAVVPDASIVEPEEGAPRLPTAADAASKHNPAPGQVPEQPRQSPANSPSGTIGPGTSVETPQAAAPSSGGAFSDQNSTDPASTGETRPLEPLAPAPVSTASTTPLWAAMVLFLFLAIGGFWLAQRRDQE